MAEPVPVIGIDLGTTYSCVGAFIDGKVQIFSNEKGFRTTPSYVSFTDDKILVGGNAKKNLILNPKNTIYDAIHLIGKGHMDETVQNNKKYWTFEVKEEDHHLVFEVEQNGIKRLVKPEKVSALVLKKMKHFAEWVLEKKVTKAVITIPAYFNQAQKQGTIHAAQMAGLEIVELVTKPVAAAITYGLDNNEYNNTNILVADINGDTFTVVVLKFKNGRPEVSAIGSDAQLGGRDFDHLFMDYCNKKIKDKHGVDCYADEHTKQWLLNKCIHIKHNLSFAKRSRLDLSRILSIERNNWTQGWMNINYVTREEFNIVCEPLFQKIIAITEATLKDAKGTPGDIKSVLLIGESSRIPHIQEILGKMFPHSKINQTINAEAVVYGAALFAKKYFDFIKIKEKFILEDFQFKETINSSRNIVNKYEHVESRKTVAIKFVNIPFKRHPTSSSTPTTDIQISNKIEKEVSTLLSVGNHPNIIDFYGMSIQDNKLLICMEYMDMTLMELYSIAHNNDGYFTENLLRAITIAILNALNFCKSLNYIHRDIKPDNILINWSGEIKLADFGEARILEDSLASTFVGTLRYFSPERFEAELEKYDVRVDVWSMGMTLLECMYGHFPIKDKEGNEISNEYSMCNKYIKQIDPSSLINNCPKRYTNFVNDFLLLCLRRYETRPKYDALMKTEFYLMYTEQMSQPSFVASILKKYKR